MNNTLEHRQRLLRPPSSASEALVFGMGPISFDGVGVCSGSGVSEVPGVHDIGVDIAVVVEVHVGFPTVGDNSCPVFDMLP